MRALVTGASGLLGYELTKLLRRHDIPVIACPGPRPGDLEARRIEALQGLSARVLPCDLRREEPFASAPPEDWDTLFHLAAYVTTETASDDVRVNDEGTRRLLNQLLLHGKRVLYSSTLAVADNEPSGEIVPNTHCARSRRMDGRSSPPRRSSLERARSREAPGRSPGCRLSTAQGTGPVASSMCWSGDSGSRIHSRASTGQGDWL